MGLFSCPRFCRLTRRRKASNSSDEFTSSYQLSQKESTVAHREDVEGISSATDPWPRSEHRGSSFGTLSGKLRMRFSRETRDTYGKPKNIEKAPGVSLFSLSSKDSTAKHGPLASHDLGSSLMSERGYDSDAQFIATPKQVVHTADYPTGWSRKRVAMSPSRNPYREADSQASREKSIEMITEGRATASDIERDSQSSWHSHSPQQHLLLPFQEPLPSAHNVDIGHPWGSVASPCPSVTRRPQFERIGLGAMSGTREMHRPHHYPVSPRPHAPIMGFEENMGQYPNTKFLGPAYSSSTESLVVPPTKISVERRRQRPRAELGKDRNSVHSDMNISQANASRSASPHMLPQTSLIDESRWTDSAGNWSANRWRELASSANSAKDTPDPKLGMQIPASYSPRPSLTHSPYENPESKSLQYKLNTPGCAASTVAESEKDDMLTTQPNEMCPSGGHTITKADIHRSKFTEQFESDRSVASNVYDSCSDKGRDSVTPRKISIGWMSGGRRVGYGYTVVSADDVNQGEQGVEGRPNSPGTCGSTEDIYDKVRVGQAPGKIHKQKAVQRGPTSKALSKMGESVSEMSNALHRLTLPHWPSANLALKKNNISDAASCNSASSSLLGIFARRRNWTETEGNGVEENPWEFCSWAPKEQVSKGGQGTVSPAHTFEDRAVGTLRAIRRKGTIWAQGRKVSAIARDLEKRAVAKLATSTEQFPAMQRTASRVFGLKPPDRSKKRGKPSDAIFQREYSVGDRTSYRVQERPAYNCSMNKPEQEGENNSTQTDSEEEWGSLYEECLEERPILE